MSDHINPGHYKLDNGAEVIDVSETLSFNLGNVVKYAARAGKKPGADTLTDLGKALWYLEREMNRLKSQKSAAIKRVIDDMDRCG